MYNPNIFATWWCKSLIFQTETNWCHRIEQSNVYDKDTGIKNLSLWQELGSFGYLYNILLYPNINQIIYENVRSKIESEDGRCKRTKDFVMYCIDDTANYHPCMADIIIFVCPTLCKFCPIISASFFTFNYDLIILYSSLYISRNKISFTSLNRLTFTSEDRHTFMS